MGSIEKLKVFLFRMPSHIKDATNEVEQAEQALGHVLVMQHIDKAKPDEVNQARVRFAHAETALRDLKLIKPLLTGFIEVNKINRIVENRLANKARMEKLRDKYEAARLDFETNLREIRKDKNILKKRADELFKLAKPAGMIGSLRKYFKRIGKSGTDLTRRLGLM